MWLMAASALPPGCLVCACLGLSVLDAARHPEARAPPPPPAPLAPQVEGSPYRGVLDAARSMARQEGLGAFFRSYRTTLVMNVPYTAMHFSVYETAKKVILEGGVGGGGALR